MHFAPGAGDALDTAAHEFTHGVTANTAGLEYECQSGALNESISDIMAWNLDPSDPTYGEDRNGGADPQLPSTRSASASPMTVDDYRATPNDRFGDWGGVHTNSGIPNHAYFEVVVRVGRDKAQQILWRALTEHLRARLGLRGLPRPRCSTRPRSSTATTPRWTRSTRPSPSSASTATGKRRTRRGC